MEFCKFVRDYLHTDFGSQLGEEVLGSIDVFGFDSFDLKERDCDSNFPERILAGINRESEIGKTSVTAWRNENICLHGHECYVAYDIRKCLYSLLSGPRV